MTPELEIERATSEKLAERNLLLRCFLLRLLDPEDLGYACTAEVRRIAWQLALRQQVEDMRHV